MSIEFRALLLNRSLSFKFRRLIHAARKVTGTSCFNIIQKTVVICGPSGTGKTTMINKLMADYPNIFEFSVSHTTRKPRIGELNGVNYHFVSKQEFSSGAKRGDFIESAEFSGNMYATSKQAIKEIQDKGKICILDLEMNGVKQIKRTKNIDPVYIFIKPPSISELESRLKGRKTETEESLTKRLSAAKSDLDNHCITDMFDTVIINDEVDEATNQLAKFIFQDIDIED